MKKTFSLASFIKKLKNIYTIIITFFLFSGLFIYGFGVQEVINSSDDVNTIKIISSDQISKELISKHIKIGNNYYELQTNNLTILQTIKKLKDLLILDIIQELDITSNKGKYLNDYLNDVYRILTISSQVINQLIIDIDKFDNKMQLCISKKEDSDSDFFSSIDSQDELQMNKAIEISKENAKCIGENRVEINSRNAILTTISYYTNLLQKKYDYISPKKEIIIKHFYLMKDSLLEELFRTREALQKNYNN